MDYTAKIDKLFLTTRFSLSVVDEKGETLYLRPADKPYLFPASLALFFLDDYGKRDFAAPYPYIHVTKEGIFIGVIPLPDSTFLLVGPSLSIPVNLRELFESYTEYFTRDQLSRLHEVCMNYSHTDSVVFSNLLATAYELFYDEELDPNDILLSNIIDNPFSKDKENVDVFNYDSASLSLNQVLEFEDKLSSVIESGNMVALEEIWQHPFPLVLKNIQIGHTASMQIVIPFLTIFRRAAITGGSDPIKTTALYDSILATANKKASADCYATIAEASYQFCSLVIASREQGAFAPIARRCEQYIQNNLRNKITIRDLALVCGISDRQLCRVFEKCYHMGITEYIHTERMRQAKIMLSSGNMKIVDIGNMLGYASQSHFTRTFMKFTGYTPNEYRKLHGIHQV